MASFRRFLTASNTENKYVIRYPNRLEYEFLQGFLMNANTNTTVKIVAALLIGFAITISMAIYTAPDHLSTAIASGALLTVFGFIFAKFAIELVVLPIAVVSLILRLIRGEKVNANSRVQNDKFDFFGRVLFVIVYGFVSVIMGIVIGAIDGGLGWFATAALFGAVGVLIAMFCPADLFWAADGGDNLDSAPTAGAKADIEQARNEGNSAVLFSDKIAKKVVDTLIENPNKKL